MFFWRFRTFEKPLKNHTRNINKNICTRNRCLAENFWKMSSFKTFLNVIVNVLSKFLSVVFSLVFFCCLPFHPLQLSPLPLLLSSSVSLRWRCPFLSQETWDEVEQKKLWTTQGQIKQNCSVKWWVSLSFFFGESALFPRSFRRCWFSFFPLGWYCFVSSCFWVVLLSSPSSGRAVCLPPSPSLGWCCFFSSFWVVLLPCTSFFQVLLLAHLLVVLSSSHLPWVVLLSLLLSSLGWCCLVSSFWWSCLPPPPRRGAAVPNYILLWK